MRTDASINLAAVAELQRRHADLDIVLIESGGDSLSTTFSPELADLTLYVINVAAGEEIPRKGCSAITKPDLLVIKQTDLAPHVGASFEVMARNAQRMRDDKAFIFCALHHGEGADAAVSPILAAGGLTAPLRREDAKG